MSPISLPFIASPARCGSRLAALLSVPFLSLLLSAACLSPAEAAPETDAPRTTETLVTFFSPSLGRDVQYMALVPDPPEPDRRYPVLYLLHGAWGSSRDWTSRTSVTAVLAGRPLIVINPDGGTFGWYLDSPLRPSSKYESFMTRDLIGDVDARFPTAADRKARGIAGLSMGGHGALSLAAKHPELFVSASSMSGILRLQNHPKDWELDQLLGDLPEAAPEWKKHSVYDLAERYTTAGVALLFDTGTSDTLSVEDCRQLHERLQALDIPHVYREYPGGHTWQYWSDRLPEHLSFHEKAFVRGKAEDQ